MVQIGGPGCWLFLRSSPPRVTKELNNVQPDEAFLSLWDGQWPIPSCDEMGSGCFGRWIVDAEGRPAYQYEIDQGTDSRAESFTTTGKSRDHWHLVGNDRIIATAHNGGYVQVYDWSRGGKQICRWDPSRHRYAGGFKFVLVEGEAFVTLWKYLPKDAVQRRIFGMGYFEKRTEYRGSLVTERIEAPIGDDPVLCSQTVIENRSGKPKEVTVAEFWYVSLHPLTLGYVMTHGLGKLVDWRRRRLSRRFEVDSSWDISSATLRVDFEPVRKGRLPDPATPARVDSYPKSVFLAALDPLPESFGAFATDGRLFLGTKDLPGSPGIHGAADGALLTRRNAYGALPVLAFRRNVRLEPGDRVELRYLYGCDDKRNIPALVHKYRDGNETTRRERALPGFATPEAPWLARELAWHSYYLQAGATYEDYFQTHLVDQGSAYGYLQGLSGAHRDFALYTLPMVYIRPDLAKDMLRFSMRSQDAKTGSLPYANVGHGVVTGAIIHGKSSDLDLFLLWALAEYLGATQDIEFLGERVPFYPLASGVSGTVLEHARAAFRHLTESVGVGRHGLIRCGTGDWNDVLIAFSRRPWTAVRNGESALNAGMAAFVLPAIAECVETADPGFAEELRETASQQAAALLKMWTGAWMARGYTGRGNTTIGHDRIFLDTQAFPVLARLLDNAQMKALFDVIQRDCVDPQSAGARAMWPPMTGPFLERGSDTNGGTWAAVDSWIVWAWATFDPKAAWEFFLKTTLARHAECYPNIWYGVWSGPDSYNADYHPRPDETFKVNFTPMTDYPIMNMNRHSGPLLDAIKLAGIGSRSGTIVVDPHLPFDSFAIRLPLIGAAYLPGRHRGYYNPVCAGAFTFAVRPPSELDSQSLTLKVNGETATHVVDSDGLVRFEAFGEPARAIRWEIGPSV